MSRILVLSRVFPPEVGGSGRWLWELYSRFPEGECVVVTQDSSEGMRFDATHDVQVIRMPLPTESWGILDWRGASEYLRLFGRLRSIVDDQQVGEVHAACVLPEGFLAWMLQRRLGIPYCVYVHGEELNIASRSRELTWMANRVFGAARLLIANSENTAKLLRANWRVNDDRLCVLRPGVDTTTHVPALSDPMVRRRLGWGDRPVVLTVGRLQARKGQDHLIRAMAEIRKAIPNALYSVVGDGNDRGRLAGLIDELGLQSHVLLQGELREEELIHAYQQCNLFALPNREVNGDIEGFGLVLLEAQACGKPVLAGNSGGTREAVGAPASGVVVDCSDPPRIADAVIELLADRGRLEEMGVAGREWVCRSFDWATCVESARSTFGLPALKPQLVAVNT